MTEPDLRRALGIPEEAERALIFTESSHWDPDWMLRAEEYYRLRVQGHLDRAIDELARDPRRVYSVECMFFFRRYWERRPRRRDLVRDLVNSGRLRMMGCGVTTPDTILPPVEALIRDYLEGQVWLAGEGMTPEPSVAYLPDSFGHSAELPAVLASLGIGAVAFSRIDGMYFLGCEAETRKHFPRTGSSAEKLLHGERTLDFIWRAADGSEAVAHWNAFTYGQGELLAHVGMTRVLGAPLAFPWRTESHVAHRVARYVRDLGPLARTPYLLCPIGFDFSAPIPDLMTLLDRYNASYYPVTGTYLVNAGLDDYLALVGHHRENLPTISFDPNPCFMGFYTSRPTLKARYYSAVHDLLSLEDRAVKRSLTEADPGLLEKLIPAIEPAWWTVATANHHDFITGTSPDRVTKAEQMRWLADARELAARVSERLGLSSQPGGAGSADPGNAPWEWSWEGSVLRVRGPSGLLEFDAERGGCLLISSASEPTETAPARLAGEVLCYEDSGGLWRMGHEIAGGHVRLVDRSGDHKAKMDVELVQAPDPRYIETGSTSPGAPALVVRTETMLGGNPLVSTWVLRQPAHDQSHQNGQAHSDSQSHQNGQAPPDSQSFSGPIGFAVRATLPPRRVLTASFPPRGSGASSQATLVADMPGGLVERAARGPVTPTFWPVSSFALSHSQGDVTAGPLVTFERPTALVLHDGQPSRPGDGVLPPGTLEIIVSRNATKETAYGFLPVLGFPARGHDPNGPPLRLACTWLASQDPKHIGVTRPSAAAEQVASIWNGIDIEGAGELPLVTIQSLVTDNREVSVLAVKPASRGKGIIARLVTYGQVPIAQVSVTAPAGAKPLRPLSAWRCDARERDIEELHVTDSGVTLSLEAAITTIRLVMAPAANAG